jgi:hypothetical protein
VQYSATQNLFCTEKDAAGGSLVVSHQLVTNSSFDSAVVRDHCNPKLDVSFLDGTFTMLIVINQFMFR